MPQSSVARARRPGAEVLWALAGAAITALVLLLPALRWRTPSDGSPEAGFARDMATHHAQAVEMSFVVRDASTDASLRALAYDIIATQSTQRGVFMGWLQQWHLPQTSSVPRMAWMPGHAGMASGGAVLMHGMATVDELAELHEARGREAEILFLQLMIRHHEGGVLMARAVIPLTRRDEVIAMARSIDAGQRAEISLMKEMLAARGARPLPSLL
jgi:uncharacterized protein (DUF305 family)